MASGWFFGLNATDDQLVWRTMLGPNAVITVSATVHRGGLLVGVSSTENQFGPKSRQKVAALDARSGRVAPQTYMTPTTRAGVGL